MPVEVFREHRFNKKTMQQIAQADAIIRELQAEGYTLTLRQLYYQFVGRGFLANTLKNYKNLGAVISDARLAGLIDWEAIEDRTRNLKSNAHWESAAHMISTDAPAFGIDKWADQPNRVEVWIEKEALIGVVEPACRAYDVAFFACRGYTSQSEQWRAGQRLAEYRSAGQEPYILHLGDHDPSGIDMTRDNDERLEMFAYENVEVRRLALNMDQVKRYKPPPNPAKMTDSRVDSYIARFGKQSWELDALSPKVIDKLIRDSILELLDTDLWNEAVKREAKERAMLRLISTRYDDVAAYLQGVS